MIETDISNIWGAASLPELLALEAEVSRAHMALLREGEEPLWHRVSDGQLRRIRETAELIRGDSGVLVVVGSGSAVLAARAAIELLREPGQTRILFAGDSLSPRRWTDLTRQLDGEAFSVCVIGGSGHEPGPAAALRELRWLLERRCGTDEARRRIYVVSRDGENVLRTMAREEDWQWLPLPEEGSAEGYPLSAAGLLPMAVAGLDIEALILGAEEAEKEFDLRSYENPAWLYAACRELLSRKGKNIELLETADPAFQTMGAWWQLLFSRTGQAVFPALADVTAGMPAAAWQETGNLFATMLHVTPAAHRLSVREDLRNPDGLNALAGKTWAQVEEMLFRERLETCVDRGMGVIWVDCGEICARTVGQLFYFFRLSSALSAAIASEV